MAGRPAKTFTAAEIRNVERWARAQAKDTTMARALGVDLKTFRAHFSATTKQKRADGKLRVLVAQYTGAINPAGTHSGDRIWWGKQHLDQTDREKVELNKNVKIEPPVIVLAPQPGREARDEAPTEPAD